MTERISRCGQAVIKGGDGALGTFLRREKDATIRQLQAGRSTKRCQPGRGIVIERNRYNAELAQRRLRIRQLVRPGRPYQDLRERERACREFLLDGFGEQISGPAVVRVTALQVRDQHARSQDDHAGQSSRSRSRYSGP